jgi:hypothetical protein
MMIRSSIPFLPMLAWCLVGLCPGAYSEAMLPSQEEAGQGWISLLDGQDLAGWRVHGTGGHWVVADGVLTATGTGGNWLGTSAVFDDFELVAEWKVSKGGNSGIFFRASEEGRPWIDGYESQIDEDDEKNPTGSIYNRIQAKKAEVPDETWHQSRIIAEGDHIVVLLNGEKVVDGSDATHRAGHIGVQFHHGGMQVWFRKIWLRPLGLKPIFNGKDFTGWRKVGSKPSYTIEDGAVRIQGGPGYLESGEDYADFMAQLEIRAEPNSNSGVFFRGPRVEGDEFKRWPQGYEAQVFNHPRDFTTGGIYGFIAARGVFSQDGEWFVMTINAVGNRLVTWVNGRPAVDWEDTENRFRDGILALQAHDPNSIIYYRKVEIKQL